MGKRPNTLKEVAERVCAGESWGALVKEFCDQYYIRINRGEEVEWMFAEEPQHLDPVRDAFLAAMAEHLGRQARRTLPRWAFDEDRFLKDPWFPKGTDNLRPMLIMFSPTAFRKRLLFVSENALSRARKAQQPSGESQEPKPDGNPEP